MGATGRYRHEIISIQLCSGVGVLHVQVKIHRLWVGVYVQVEESDADEAWAMVLPSGSFRLSANFGFHGVPIFVL